MATVVTDVMLDAGFFIGHERGSHVCTMWTAEFNARNARLATVATVVGEVWRNGARQARLSRFLSTIDIVVVDLGLAKATGELLAKTGSSATVDASLVAAAAVRRAAVLTSDPGDLAPLATALGVELFILGRG